jgi:chemotaxis protein methyltransferase CheR
VGAGDWFDAIARSSERIQALSQTAGRTAAPDAARTSPIAQADLGPALELLRRERFADALAVLQTLPPHAAGSKEALLLRALLLIHGGQLGPAEQTCSELLEHDPFNAGAHYLLALCSEARGDKQRARDHDQLAIHLDPSFVMARLHLGLVARRLGDWTVARRELGHALDLLPCEDASRLLLFGGGFERAALVALCRAELLAAGGTP